MGFVEKYGLTTNWVCILAWPLERSQNEWLLYFFSLCLINGGCCCSKSRASFLCSLRSLAHNWSIHMLLMVWWIGHHFYVTLNIDPGCWCYVTVYSVNDEENEGLLGSHAGISFLAPLASHWFIHYGCVCGLGSFINHMVKFLTLLSPFVETFTKHGLCYKMAIWLTPIPSTVYVFYE